MKRFMAIALSLVVLTTSFSFAKEKDKDDRKFDVKTLTDMKVMEAQIEKSEKEIKNRNVEKFMWEALKEVKIVYEKESLDFGEVKTDKGNTMFFYPKEKKDVVSVESFERDMLPYYLITNRGIIVPADPEISYKERAAFAADRMDDYTFIGVIAKDEDEDHLVLAKLKYDLDLEDMYFEKDVPEEDEWVYKMDGMKISGKDAESIKEKIKNSERNRDRDRSKRR